VDPINSVQFSNHTGYKNGVTGQVLDGKQLLELVSGLEKNSLVSEYTHLLTGFIGSVSFLRNIIQVFNTLKAKCTDIQYFCDPVLGDNGKLYVPEALVEVYRNEIIPIASILTPNQFELEILSQIKITDMTSAHRAMDFIHEKGVRTVVLTSGEFLEDASRLSLLLSTRLQNGGRTMYTAEFDKVEGKYTGTGDLIAALLLAWLTREKDVESAIFKACTSMNAVLRRTKASSDLGVNPNNELHLIQSRQDIEHPDLGASTVKVHKLTNYK